MPSSITLGLPPFLDVAHAAWRGCDPAVERRQVAQHPDYRFDERSLLLPTGSRVFVAIDNRFLNHKRLELANLLRARGYELAAVVARTAVVEGALERGVFVGEGAVIALGATIGEFACIGARAVIGPGANLERGAWVEPGAIIGAHAKIGERTTIGSGVVVPVATEIGASCVLAIPGIVRGPIGPRTYLHPQFPEPIRGFSR